MKNSIPPHEEFRKMDAWVGYFKTMTDSELAEITSAWTSAHLAYMSKALWTMSTQASIASLLEAASKSWWRRFATRWLPIFGNVEDALRPATLLRVGLLSRKTAMLVALWSSLPCIGLMLWLTSSGPAMTWLHQQLQPARTSAIRETAPATSGTPTGSGATGNALPSEVEHSNPRKVGTGVSASSARPTHAAASNLVIEKQRDDQPAAISCASTTSSAPARLPDPRFQDIAAQKRLAEEISAFIAMLIWTLMVWRIAATPDARVPKMSLACENDFARLLENLGAADGQRNPALTACVHQAFDKELPAGTWLPAEIALLMVLAAGKSKAAKQVAYEDPDLKFKNENKVRSRALKQLNRLGMLD